MIGWEEFEDGRWAEWWWFGFLGCEELDGRLGGEVGGVG